MDQDRNNHIQHRGYENVYRNVLRPVELLSKCAGRVYYISQNEAQGDVANILWNRKKRRSLRLNVSTYAQDYPLHRNQYNGDKYHQVVLEKIADLVNVHAAQLYVSANQNRN